jgi:hypothetical protein
MGRFRCEPGRRVRAPSRPPAALLALGSLCVDKCPLPQIASGSVCAPVPPPHPPTPTPPTPTPPTTTPPTTTLPLRAGAYATRLRLPACPQVCGLHAAEPAGPVPQPPVKRCAGELQPSRVAASAPARRCTAKSVPMRNRSCAAHAWVGVGSGAVHAWAAGQQRATR